MSGEKGVAAEIRARVLHAYADLGNRNTLDAGDNRVRKIPLGVTGVDVELIVVELIQDESAAGNDVVRVRGGMERQEIQLLQSQVVYLCQEIRDIRSKRNRRHAINQQHNQKVLKLFH